MSNQPETTMLNSPWDHMSFSWTRFTKVSRTGQVLPAFWYSIVLEQFGCCKGLLLWQFGETLLHPPQQRKSNEQVVRHCHWGRCWPLVRFGTSSIFPAGRMCVTLTSGETKWVFRGLGKWLFKRSVSISNSTKKNSNQMTQSRSYLCQIVQRTTQRKEKVSPNSSTIIKSEGREGLSLPVALFILFGSVLR